MGTINIWVDSSWLGWTGGTWEPWGQWSVDCKLPQAVYTVHTTHSPVYCVVNWSVYYVVSGLWVVLTVLFCLCGETVTVDTGRWSPLGLLTNTLCPSDSLSHWLMSATVSSTICLQSHCLSLSVTAMSTLLSLDPLVPINSPCKFVFPTFVLLCASCHKMVLDAISTYIWPSCTWFKPFILDTRQTYT